VVPKLALGNRFVLPIVALGQGLRFLKWRWGMVCGAQSGTWAVFLVLKLPMGQSLWCLNWHRACSFCTSAGFCSFSSSSSSLMALELGVVFGLL